MHIRRCCIAAVLALARVAVADPNPEAEKLFRDGRADLKAGRVAAACDKLTASSRLDPAVGTLLNVGDCRARLGQTATAWAAFVEAAGVAKRTGDARRAEAERRASELEPKLSYLTVTVGDAVTGETVTRAGTPLDSAAFGEAVPLDPGSYEITASAPGHRSWSRTVALHGGGDHRLVRVPELEAVPAATVVQIPSPRAAAEREIAPPPASPSMFTAQRDVAIATGVAGLAALGASAVLALQAKSLESDARAACPAGQPCTNLAASKQSSDAVAKADLATYVGLAGVAALGAGAVVWFTGAPEPHITPHVTGESVGVSLGGKF